jgi:adenylate cyclase
MAPTKKAAKLSHLRWLLLLPIPILWCALSHYGHLTFLENRLLDLRFKYRGEIEAPVKVVYVDIDSLSLDPKEIGGWPWSRMYFARVADALVNEAKVKAVGIDVVFSTSGASESMDWKKRILGNAEFGKFLIKAPPVVLAAEYSGWQFIDPFGHAAQRSLPILEHETRPLDKIEPPELPGFETNSDPDRPTVWSPPFSGLIDTLDNGARIVPAFAQTATRTYYHMALELARLYWGLPVGSIKVASDHVAFVRPDGSVVSTIPLMQHQLIEVNWFTHWESANSPHVEFSDVFKYAEALKSDDAEERKLGKAFFTQEEFKNAVVLIGPVDKLFQDLAPTPLDDVPVPKVSVHGNLLKTIVSGIYLRRLSENSIYAIVFGLTLIVSVLALAGGARALFAKIMAVLAVAIYVALAFQIFTANHIVLPLTAPLGAAFTTSFAGLIWQVIDEQKAKGRIKGMFGAYVSPQLVDRMVESGEDPQLGGHEEEITAYFSDIQSFSTFSEKLPPGKLVDLMNEFLTACTDIVQAQGGTLDKYIGDAVVAMFGAPIPLPDHALRACVATQLVQQKIGELRAKWESEGEKWPQIVWRMQTRIGLNTGRCIIGNMGSRTRFNYTMMGDDVNLAARMESGAKSWGAYTMVTETTKLACEQYDAGRVVFRPLGRIVVKGRSQAVPIHEIVGLKETATASARECIQIFNAALERYFARDWDAALKLFAQSRDLEPNVPGKTPGVVSNPSLVYLDITEHYKHEPPAEGWDGVYVMKEK